MLILLEVIGASSSEKTRTLNYIVNLPNNYDDRPNELFPVIVFLHGAGERGNDINLVKKYGIHRYSEIINIPFIIISPQCHANNFWDIHFTEIEFLLQEIKIKYRANIEKICLAGISLGAYGAWNFAMQRPRLFSSIVSIAGGAMIPKYANLISHIPAYIVHGELDKEVNVMESIEISESLNKAGGKVNLIIIPEIGHEVCTKIFESNELYKWIEDNTR